MILFGPAGNSESFYNEGHKRTVEVFSWIADMGLNAYEYSFGRGVRMRGADEHFLRLPTRAPCDDGLGFVGFLASVANGVDQRDDGAAFAVLKGDGADVKRVVDVFRWAGTELKGDDIGIDLNGGGSDVKAGLGLGRCRRGDSEE